MKVIALDPGHGGKDPGAVGNGLQEKDVVFGTRKQSAVLIADGMAQRIAHYLRKAGMGVVLTRTQDVNPSKRARAAAAGKAGAVAFVSLHCNASTRVLANGCEVWYSHRGYSDRARSLASEILDALLELDGLFSRGIKSSRSSSRADAVLKRAAKSMPSVLVELAFITNPEDAQLLASRKWRDSAAREIAMAISGFFAA